VVAVVIQRRTARSAVVNDNRSGSVSSMVAAWCIRARIAW
jgi:hypothetical protein